MKYSKRQKALAATMDVDFKSRSINRQLKALGLKLRVKKGCHPGWIEVYAERTLKKD